MSGYAHRNQAIQATATATGQQQAAVQAVTVSTVPVVSALPREEARSDFEVLVRVRAPTDATRRAPLDLVAVLDVSGSMNRSPEGTGFPAAGKPSRLRLLKDAMKFIVGNLADGDRLAIVPFNHDVVPLPEGSSGIELTKIDDNTRESLSKTVDGLTAVHYTLFAPGLDKALKILKDERSASDKEKRVGFIVFLSDGDEYAPTQEEQKKYKITLSKDFPDKGDWKKKLEGRLKEYKVHTFGFSKYHDPAALHGIADISGGTYSFLNTGLDKITDAFGFCLGGLKTVVATGVTIDLTVQHPNVKITRIDSGGYRHSDVEKEHASGWIEIPVLYAGEVKDFIVHLSVPSHGRSTQELLRVDGECRRPDDDGAADGVDELQVARVQITRPLQADSSNNQQGQLKQNGEVIEKVLCFKVVKMLKDFLDQTKSRNLKNKSIADEAKDLLGNMWIELKKDNQSILNDLDESVVERYNGYVQKMQHDLKGKGGDGDFDGDGGANVMAFYSSNNMQQITIIGSPDNVIPEFKTEEMKKLGTEAKKQRGEPLAPEDVPPPPAAAARSPDESWPCGCVEYGMVGRQLAYWSVVKRDLLLLVEQVEGDGGHCHLTGTFHDLSLASINRAMYESVFLAVEHAHNLKSCYCAATGQRAVVVRDGDWRRN